MKLTLSRATASCLRKSGRCRKDFYEITWATVRAHTTPDIADRILIPYEVGYQHTARTRLLTQGLVGNWPVFLALLPSILVWCLDTHACKGLCMLPLAVGVHFSVCL